jgi:hypothetical protein
MIQIDEVIFICQVMKHVTENSLIIMEDICALKEKIRKLEHEKNIQYHNTRSRFFFKMCGKAKNKLYTYSSEDTFNSL